MEGLERARERGKIRAIGVSNFSVCTDGSAFRGGAD